MNISLWSFLHWWAQTRITLQRTAYLYALHWSASVWSLWTFRFMVGSSGLEPPTSRLSGARSNHLSYAPLWLFLAVPLLIPLVEMMGIEPMTPCLQGRCSPSWATPPSVWVSFSFLNRLLKIEQQVDLCFLSTALLHPRRLLFGFFAYLQIRDICEWYLTFSIERRWSSRTFRYGYLVTT